MGTAALNLPFPGILNLATKILSFGYWNWSSCGIHVSVL